MVSTIRRTLRVDDTTDIEALAAAVGVLRRFVASCSGCGATIPADKLMCSICACK